MTKFSQIKVCDSKIKYSTEIAVQYVIAESKTNLSQDYYLCEMCNNYHIFTIQKKTANKRIFSTKKRNKIILKKKLKK